VIETIPATISPSRLRERPWMTLVIVAMGVIMVGIDGSVVAVANPYIGRDLHASLADLQWVTNAYLLVIAVTLILGGKLGDHFGRRRVFLIGVIGFSLTSLAIGLVGSIGGVILLRGVQGAFGALLLPNTLALLRAAYPPDDLNRAVGIWVSASATATAAGPIVGGLFIEHISWQSVFFINVPVGVATVVLGVVVLLESRESERHRFDIPGVATLAFGLLAIVYALVKAQSWGWGSARTIGLIAVGLALLVTFTAIEHKTTHPLIPLGIFDDRSVSLSIIIVLLNFFALFGVLFFVGLYLQSVHGYSPVAAGVRVLPLTITFALSSNLGARLTNRFGPWLPVTVGLLATALALLSLTTLQVDSSYVHLWPAFILVGLGIGLVVTAATDAIVGNTPVDEAGVAGGIQGTAIQLGGVLGTAVCGSILGAKVASVLLRSLLTTGVPTALAQRLARGTASVSQGLAPIPSGDSGRLAAAITGGSHAAFMQGLHLTMMVAGVVALVGAVMGPFIRRGSRHEGPKHPVL
jgi:EmrB/QacA subfamily drug resistance transporter